MRERERAQYSEAGPSAGERGGACPKHTQKTGGELAPQKGRQASNHPRIREAP